MPALLEGIGSLSNGMNTLTENLPSLTDGVQQLLDGANELKDGLNTFDEEGVSKLVSLVEDDLADMLDRVKAALNAANAYTTYTSLGENMTAASASCGAPTRTRNNGQTRIINSRRSSRLG